MKAVIVDLNGNDAVALRDDGQFVRLKNNDYNIGQEITIQAPVRHITRQAAIAASAAVVLLAGGGYGTYTWNNPISYISLDINPSIEYSLNAFDRVIAVTGMNEEGAAVVDAMGNSLKNVDITTALTITVEQLSMDAYLVSDDTNYMIIGVYSDKNSKADSLKSTVDQFVPDSVEECSIATVNVTKEVKDTADSYGITGGKMELITEIANVSTNPSAVDPATLADLSVAELEQTKEQITAGNTAVAENAADTPATETETDDPDLIVSDSKTDAENAEETGDAASDNASSMKKDDAAAENNTNTDPAVTSPVAVDHKPDKDNGKNDQSAPGTQTPTAKPDSTNSSDSHGNGSSDKKNDDASEHPNQNSDNKDDTISSDKKGSSSSDKKGSSSSDKKGNASSDKNDGNEPEVTEDQSSQIKDDLIPNASDDTFSPGAEDACITELPADQVNDPDNMLS